MAFLITIIVILILGFWLTLTKTVIVSSILFAIMFLAVVGLRLASLFPAGNITDLPSKPLPGAALPVYTVLVPLFRETRVISQLVKGLIALDYPANKLDIKLILEANDRETRSVVSALNLPDQFDVIVVPHAAPQTKPKALNYALHFTRGELVVVFDAEDVPEPDQLRRAAEAFAAAPPDLVCLQARLTYYNANENWLTRQCSIEYAVLFELVLPLLASLKLPLPLGGTSNHFRMDALSKLGGWDPFNVTEDADLGIRLARFGWRADMLASTTYEEANNAIGNWMHQRSRWLKGWIQTWFVHMRHPVVLWRQMGALDFLIVQIVFAGIVISTLAHPVFLIVILSAAANGVLLPLDQPPVAVFLTGLGLSVFLAGYGVSLVAGLVAIKMRGLQQLRWAVLALPGYWILISIGGWIAVKQFITHPFHWNKTAHGLSKVTCRRQNRPRQL